MLDKWIMNLVIAFVLRQLSKVRTSVDWAALKIEADAAVRAVVPGEWFDDEVVAVVNEVIDAFAAALADAKDIEDLITDVVAQDWPSAVAALKAILLAVWQPTSAVAKRFQNALAA